MTKKFVKPTRDPNKMYIVDKMDFNDKLPGDFLFLDISFSCRGTLVEYLPRVEQAFQKYLGDNWKDKMSEVMEVLYQHFVYLDQVRNFLVDEVECETLWDAHDPERKRVLYPAAEYSNHFRLTKTLSECAIFMDELKAGGADAHMIQVLQKQNDAMSQKLKDATRKDRVNKQNLVILKESLDEQYNTFQQMFKDFDPRKNYARTIDQMLENVKPNKVEKIHKKLIGAAKKAKRNWFAKTSIWTSKTLVKLIAAAVIFGTISGAVVLENQKVASKYYAHLKSEITHVWGSPK